MLPSGCYRRNFNVYVFLLLLIVGFLLTFSLSFGLLWDGRVCQVQFNVLIFLTCLQLVIFNLV